MPSVADAKPKEKSSRYWNVPNDTFVGTLEVAKSYAFLVTENRTLANDIFIPKEKLKGGKTGDKAIVKVVEWPDKAKEPIGQVIDILGRAGDNTTEMHAILAEYGLPYHSSKRSKMRPRPFLRRSPKPIMPPGATSAR